MKPKGLKVGDTVIFEGQIGRIDSLSWDMFTGEPLYIVNILGELKVAHLQSLRKTYRK